MSAIERVWFFSVLNTQKLVILFRLAVRIFSTEVYTSTLVCCVSRSWSNFERHETSKKELQLNVCTFTCRQLQLLTSNCSPWNWDMLLMGCVRALGVPDRSQGWAARNESIGDFVTSKLPTRITKKGSKSTFWFILRPDTYYHGNKTHDEKAFTKT